MCAFSGLGHRCQADMKKAGLPSAGKTGQVGHGETCHPDTSGQQVGAQTAGEMAPSLCQSDFWQPPDMKKGAKWPLFVFRCSVSGFAGCGDGGL